MGVTAFHDALDDAHGRFVRLFPVAGPPIDGLVIEVGAAACVLAQLDAATRPDGWHLVPLDKLDGLQDPGPNADFIERALAARALDVEVPPDLPLDSVSAALNAASRQFPVFTVAWGEGKSVIGQIMDANTARVRLVLMDDDDATWKPGTAVLETPDLVRATFGTARQETLQLVSAGIQWSAPA